MPTEREVPHTQTSAPVKPARTTRDVPDREPHEEQGPGRDAAAEERGDHMPKGADEPGAGL